MTPEDFKRLVAAGMNTDQIALVMEMMERESRSAVEADEVRKQKARDRVAKWRERHRNVSETSQKVTVPLTGEGARVEDKTLTSEIEPQEQEGRKDARERAFGSFWSLYPHRVGKADASKAFDRALKRAPLETILVGLRRYAAKTDDRPWCNPATWLNQDRWTDEPAAPVARAGPAPPRMNPTLAAALELKEKMDALSPSEIEGNHPPPRLVAIGGGAR